MKLLVETFSFTLYLLTSSFDKNDPHPHQCHPFTRPLSSGMEGFSLSNFIFSQQIPFSCAVEEMGNLGKGTFSYPFHFILLCLYAGTNDVFKAKAYIILYFSIFSMSTRPNHTQYMSWYHTHSGRLTRFQFVFKLVFYYYSLLFASEIFIFNKCWLFSWITPPEYKYYLVRDFYLCMPFETTDAYVYIYSIPRSFTQQVRHLIVLLIYILAHLIIEHHLEYWNNLKQAIV